MTTEPLRVELGNCTNTLLREIQTPELKRRDIAQTYRLAMQSSEPTDWAKVNAAIIERWSLSALEYIKRLAWGGRCFDSDAPKGVQ